MVATTFTQPEAVVVNVCSIGDSALNRKVTGIIQKSAGKSLTLVTGEEIPATSNVTVQSADLIFLGAVQSCVRECNAEWTTQIQIDRKFLVV